MAFGFTVDGGKTHLEMIMKMIDESKFSGKFAVAALAKREETIHRMNKEPLVLDRRGRVLIHARDEVHRFVNSFHRQRRNKHKFSDPLENVVGLGAKKFQTLIFDISVAVKKSYMLVKKTLEQCLVLGQH